MPWTERTFMTERLSFISRLEAGESMTDLCKEFSISRKTGYKFWDRYKTDGVRTLEDYSRRPYHCPHKTSSGVTALLVEIKKEKPHWGATKVRELLRRRYPNVKIPARSTVHLILEAAGLVEQAKKRNPFRSFAKPTGLTLAQNPNDIWCIDFKGQFKTLDKVYCYPLTVTDLWSRYVIGCEALLKTESKPVFHAFTDMFEEYGLPLKIRSDNGSPFASKGLMGLTKLSVWFLRLGVQLERIRPGHPQENGQHERFHRTLKKQTTLPPEKNILRQQQRFNDFKAEFNNERPHEGLNLKLPKELYKKSKRKMPSFIPDLEYNSADLIRRVTDCGSITFDGTRNHTQRFYLGSALAKENIGLTHLGEDLWNINFIDYDIGLYDAKLNLFTPKP